MSDADDHVAQSVSATLRPKIVELPSPHEPNAELIKILESVLRDAKAGKIRNMMAVSIAPDGSRTSIWVHDQNNVWPLLGALQSMVTEYHFRYVQPPRSIDD